METKRSFKCKSDFYLSDKLQLKDEIMLKELNIREFIDGRKLSKLQFMLITIGLISALLDGLDVVIIGFIAPALKADWGLTNNDLAPIMSAALAGLAFGAIALGPLSDKIGRKKILCLCLFGFGVFTLLTAMSSTITEIVIWRFFTGIFMGGILPQIVTLVTDYCPLRMNGRLVTSIIAAYTVGCALGGFLAAWIIPDFGWRMLLAIVGIMPIIVALIAIKLVPESIGYMVAKKFPEEKIKTIAAKIDSTIDLSKIRFIVKNDNDKQLKNPVKFILSKKYRFETIGLWWCYGVGVYVVYLLSSWLPILISSNGFTPAQASIISAFFQLGGPIGCILTGYLMDKIDHHFGMIIAYLCSTCALLAAGLLEPNYLTYAIVCMFMGMWAHGTNAGLNSLSSSTYPVEARATGNSFMHGIARIGAVLSIFAGAIMLNAGFSPQGIFLSLIIPVLSVIVLVSLMKIRKKRRLAESSVTDLKSTDISVSMN